MERTLIDNSSEALSMCRVLNECISTEGIDTIRIATGYWDIPGTALVIEKLEEFLEKEGTTIRLLIGEDPTVRAYQLTNPKYAKATRYPNDYIRTDLMELDVKPEYVRVVNFLKEYCTGEHPRMEIHVFTNKLPKEKQQIEEFNEASIACGANFNETDTDNDDKSRFFHSKSYIFTSPNGSEAKAYAIVGSSNFTKMGLMGNSELNYLENEVFRVAATSIPYPNQKSFVMWFEEKWERSEDWTREFMEEVLNGTPVGERPKIKAPIAKTPNIQLTPYELYIKLLQTKFGNLVDKNLGEMIQSYLPLRYSCYNYQIDAVKQCFSTMKEHGGFLLADVVGLGKTIVGTLLIKHFLQIPDEDGREAKVLIVTPPAIQSAWRNTIAEFDRGSENKIAACIDFITTGSIGKLIEEDDGSIEDDTGEFEGELMQEDYGLIIIDESHKFRTSTTAMYEALDNLIAQIGSNTGAYPYIGLLSATPQNNRPADLQNQIYLFERNHADSTLKKAKGGNLEGFFAEINREYATLMHPKDDDPSTPEERNAQLKDLSKRIRDNVLADIMVRRTRTDVQLYYKDDMERQGIVFPSIEGPISMEYKMSKSLAKLFYDSMSSIAPEWDNLNGLMYYRYRAIQYLMNPEDKKKYNARGSRTADALAEQLANIMQINLVKRLESSFTAFLQSLLNLRQYTQNMIDMWEHDCIFICPQFDVNAELDRKKKEAKRGRKVSLEDCFNDMRKRIRKLNEEGRNEQDSNKEYRRTDFDKNYITLLRQDYDIISDLCDRWSKNSEDPKFDEFKENLRFTLFNKDTNRPQKLVIFTEAIDTADSITKAAEAKGFRVLKITASNRDDNEQVIRENFDANYKGEWKNDFDVIVTTDVLAEGINLHRANCILNYDTPWNSTRLMQRIGRVNRIGSTEEKVYVYNFMPSAEGDAEIQLVQKAHTKLQSFHTLFGEDSQVFSTDEEVEHYDLNTQVNGEESPLEKYVYELKQYKEANPLRYSLIERATKNLEIATPSDDGGCYFVVKTPHLSGMFVRVDKATGKGCIVPAIDMFTRFKTSEDAQTIDLPENWDAYKKTAEKVVNQQLHKMNVRMGKSTKATKAKEILIAMKAKQQMSDASKVAINDAFQLVNKGNADIIKKVIAFDTQARSQQLSLWAPTQEDFDAMIESEMSNIIATVQKKHGKAEVLLGLAK